MEQPQHNTIKISLVGRLQEFRRLLVLTLPKIEQEWLWQQPNPHISSIGVQLKHMEGNLRQYMLVNLTRQKDQRERQKEFETNPQISLDALSEALLTLLQQVKSIIDDTPNSVWNEVYTVQTFSLTRLEACVHGVEHLNYHLGQIALLIKYYKPQDLSFYPEISKGLN